MVFGFGILVLAALFIASGISGRTLAQVVRSEVGRGFALANISVPTLQLTERAEASTTTASNTGGTKVTGSSSKKGLHEVFYDPLGKYYDEGTVVSGAIGGHSDHVHVSADEPLLGRLAKIASQQFKLTVREYAPYDPVDPVHTSTSYHYRGKAMDVSGSSANMMAFARYVMGA